MTLLDRQAPATWTAHHVKLRLLEAFATERKIPEKRVNGGGSTWPPIIREWQDYVHHNIPGDDARTREWQRWERTKCALPFEVSRMEEALQWVVEILGSHREEQDAVQIWARVTAMNRSLARELRKRGLSRASLYRNLTAGCNRIAAALNAKGVALR